MLQFTPHISHFQPTLFRYSFDTLRQSLVYFSLGAKNFSRNFSIFFGPTNQIKTTNKTNFKKFFNTHRLILDNNQSMNFVVNIILLDEAYQVYGRRLALHSGPRGFH